MIQVTRKEWLFMALASFGLTALAAWYYLRVALDQFVPHCREVDSPCLPLLVPILVAVGILIVGVFVGFVPYAVANIPQQRSVDSERNP